MIIDWETAPEATHWDPRDCNFLKQFCGISLVWHTGKGWANHQGQYPNDLRELGRLIARPPIQIESAEWTGEELPPAGAVCEMLRDTYFKMDWQAVTFLCAGSKKAFFRDKDGDEWSRPLSELTFRPIRTPEQIAADKRLHEIRNALTTIKAGQQPFPNDLVRGNITLSVVEAMIDAGYRKEVKS